MDDRKVDIDLVFNKLNIARATAPPFLFAQVQARLHRSHNSYLNRILCLLSRPSVAILFLMVILFADIAVIKYGDKEAADMKSQTTKMLDDSELDVIAFYEERGTE